MSDEDLDKNELYKFKERVFLRVLPELISANSDGRWTIDGGNSVKSTSDYCKLASYFAHDAAELFYVKHCGHCCSFCGSTSGEVNRMVADSGGACICDSCIKKSLDLVSDKEPNVESE